MSPYQANLPSRVLIPLSLCSKAGAEALTETTAGEGRALGAPSPGPPPKTCKMHILRELHCLPLHHRGLLSPCSPPCHLHRSPAQQGRDEGGRSQQHTEPQGTWQVGQLPISSILSRAPWAWIASPLCAQSQQPLGAPHNGSNSLAPEPGRGWEPAASAQPPLHSHSPGLR